MRILSGLTRRMAASGRRELAEAAAATDPAHKWSHAHLAALRFAGVALSLREPGRVVRGSRSAWVRLARSWPQLAPWAARFAGGAQVRSALDLGARDVVSAADADAWLAAAEEFGDVVMDLMAHDPAAADERVESAV